MFQSLSSIRQGAPSLLFFVIAAAVVLLALNVNAELHARIESCSGWALNKLPILKSFLKDGEAESYHNVHVVYIPGKKAIMTIYERDHVSMMEQDHDVWDENHGGVEVKEQIVLSDYTTKVCWSRLLYWNFINSIPLTPMRARLLVFRRKCMRWW